MIVTAVIAVFHQILEWWWIIYYRKRAWSE